MRVELKEAGDAADNRIQVGKGVAEDRGRPQRAKGLCGDDAIPELPQPRHPVLRLVAGNQRAVDCADRGADHPVRLDAPFRERLVHAGLIGAQGTAALQHEHHLLFDGTFGGECRSLLRKRLSVRGLTHHRIHRCPPLFVVYQWAVQPPSIGRIAPVIEAASAEARNAQSAAICPTVTNCLVGWAARSTSLTTCSSLMPRDLAISGICFSTNGVNTYPGHTALTVMPRSATSRATVLVSPATPCFAAA